MARSRGSKIELTAYDDLFQTDESREEAALSRIRDIPISEIDEFPDHPFKVLMNEDMEQLVDDGRHTLEGRRSRYAAECRRDFFHRYMGGKMRSVHVLRFRMKDNIHAFFLAEGAVRLQIAGISGQIFVRPELDRIDEDADDDAVIFRAGSVDEASVTVVKIAHRRHEADGKAGFLPFRSDGLNFRRL